MRKFNRICSILLAGMLAAGSMQAVVFAAQQEAKAQTEASAKAEAAAKAEEAAKAEAEAKAEQAAKAEEAAKAEAEAAAKAAVPAVYQKKIDELSKQYSLMPAGVKPYKADAKEFYTSMESPFEEKADGGILFTDVRDYDRDGAQELLVLRRERGIASLMEDGVAYDTEMYEYTFEMYESPDNECELTASSSFNVFDVLNWSINFKSITAFLHETEKNVDICVETFISQQDHPSDTALFRVRYNGSEFVEEDGMRYGYWYRENGVRCMKPVSEEAMHYLSDMFPNEDTFWKDIAATESETDAAYLKARDGSLKDLGFTVVKTRQEIMDEYNTEDMDDAALAKIDAEFSAISAMDCYAPIDGTMTMMAFLHEYIEPNMDDEGMVVVDRTLDTERKTVNTAKAGN